MLQKGEGIGLPIMKNSIAIPFAVETGVNYLSPSEDEMSDGEFVSAIVESADCGFLHTKMSYYER